MNESLGSYPDKQRGGDRTTRDQGFSGRKGGQFIDIGLAELFGRFNDEPLIVGILDPHRDQCIALAGYIRVELAWALADNCKSNPKFPTLGRDVPLMTLFDSTTAAQAGLSLSKLSDEYSTPDLE